MRYVLLMQSGSPIPSSVESLASGDEVTILLPLGRDGLASQADRELDSLRREAERLESRLSSKGIGAKVVVEWGEAQPALDNCLRREEAVQLK
ncbi:MAG: hypothetical protein V1787_00305 [Candidatus Micrarchaeota archaeon]